MSDHLDTLAGKHLNQALQAAEAPLPAHVSSIIRSFIPGFKGIGSKRTHQETLDALVAVAVYAAKLENIAVDLQRHLDDAAERSVLKSIPEAM